MYVALPVGGASEKRGRQGVWHSWELALIALHVCIHTNYMYEEVDACTSENHCFMNTFENTFIVFLLAPVSSIIGSRCTKTFVQTHTHPFAVLFSLFILCWLIPKWHFLWSPIYVSTPRPPLTSPLISSALCLCLPLHTFSVKQLVFPVRSFTFVRFNNKW